MSVLDKIAAYKREEIAAAKAVRPLPALLEDAKRASPPRGFRAALDAAKAEGRPGVIGEIKKASPSKATIRADFNPEWLARAYERGGAACLSVLTDGPSFQGSPEYLTIARRAVSLPVLRKDFMLEPYQIVESRALGADCILVILAMLDDSPAREVIATAREWGMDVLVEVHDERELERALTHDANLIGINNRDLKTFVTDIGTSIRLMGKVPAGSHVVAESGLSSPEDLRKLAEVGITSYLIGESLMRASDVGLATEMLIAGAAR